MQHGYPLSSTLLVEAEDAAQLPPLLHVLRGGEGLGRGGYKNPRQNP